MKKIFSLIKNPCLIIMLIFCAIFFIDGINSIQHSIIGYDEGYNATVAANLVRHGEYRVSYPYDIVFYNMITTGTPVLLPTAVLYKFFGINYVTSAIVPLIYMTLSIFAIWVIISKSLNFGKTGQFISLIMISLIVLSDSVLIPSISTHLIGESACIFFLAIACLLLERGYSSAKNIPFIGAGVMVMASFLTKSSTIFFLVSLIGLILFETLIKNISIKNALSFYFGLAGGFVIIDSYKFKQLGLVDWLDWWDMEWDNMLGQSGQKDVKPPFIEKFEYLTEILGFNQYISLLIIALPVVLYLIFLYMKLRKKTLNISKASYCACLLGIAASSLEIFYLLFGGEGLIYSRRHVVNAIFLKVIFLIAIGRLIIWIISWAKEKKRIYYALTIIPILILLFLFPINQLLSCAKDYVTLKKEDEYDFKLIKTFLSDVNEINPEAHIFCNGWWQEPLVTLFLDRTMEDISGLDEYDLNTIEAYFIIGRRFDGCSIEDVEEAHDITLERANDIPVDYDAFWTGNGSNLFTIFRIHPNNTANE